MPPPSFNRNGGNPLALKLAYGTPPKRRKLTRRGEQRRKELLHGAMLLFSEHGYEPTTTKSIAESCGVTEAVIFRYFPTKQDLFREVVDTYSPALHYELPFENYRELPFGEALRSLLRDY